MAEERKVALGVDSSEHANFAFQWYVDNVYREGDLLVCINSPEVQNVHGSNPADVEEMLRESNKQVQELEKAYTEKLAAVNIKGKFRVGQGKPGEVVCRIAEEEKVDIIITGTRGLGKLRRTVMGSVSDYIVHHAKVPVLVCRNSK